ncbi:hypothetical protein PUN28_014170 [Cardiocondyla obscurior]|uniref:Transposase n=1 Tax=Cardiocondyla obscurior TaxID=286306 RepID=A0AAW2EYT6_9HYME
MFINRPILSAVEEWKIFFKLFSRRTQIERAFVYTSYNLELINQNCRSIVKKKLCSGLRLLQLVSYIIKVYKFNNSELLND